MTDPLARFECSDIENAKQIILMPEVGLSSDQRWVQETEWLLSRLIFDPGPILDFGCGIGRLAKFFADAEHPVTGIDASETMRDQAMRYVDSEHFRVGSPQDLDTWIEDGWRAQSVICAWVLQHVLDIRLDVRRISDATMKGGWLYLLNRTHRAIPIGETQWHDDGFAVAGMLSAFFAVEFVEAVPDTLCAPGAYFSQWRRL